MIQMNIALQQINKQLNLNAYNGILLQKTKKKGHWQQLHQQHRWKPDYNSKQHRQEFFWLDRANNNNNNIDKHE